MSAVERRQGPAGRFARVRRRAHAEPSAFESGFRAIFERSLDAIILFDDERKMVDGNRAACEFFGLTREDLRTHTIDTLASSEQLRTLDQIWDSFMAAGSQAGEFGIALPGGGLREVEYSASANVMPGIHLAIFRDVTARHEAHAALRQSELRLRTLLETANEGILVIDPLDRTMFANARIADMLGYPIEEMLGRPIHEFVDDDTRPLIQELMAARRRGESDQNELRLRRKDGGEIWAIVTGSSFVGLEGSYDGSLAMVTDITERKLQEQAVQAAAERYRNIIETTSEGVWMIDADHRTTYVNARMAEMLGYRVEEMLGRPVAQFIREERRDPLETALERQGLTDQREVCYVRKDGSEMWGLLSGSPLTDGSGAYGGALAMISDITERKRAEEQLARLAAIVDASPDAIFSTNADGIVSTWNLAAQRLYGYSAREAIGRPITRLVPEERFDEIEQLIGRLREGETIPAFRTQGLTKDRRRIDIVPSLSAIRAGDGRVVGTLAIVREP